MRLIIVLALVVVTAFCHPAWSRSDTLCPINTVEGDQEFTTYERQRRSPCDEPTKNELTVIIDEEGKVSTVTSFGVEEEQEGSGSESSEGSGANIEEPIVKRSADDGSEETTEEEPDVDTEGSGTIAEEPIMKRSAEEDDEEDSEDQEFTTYERRLQRSPCSRENTGDRVSIEWISASDLPPVEQPGENSVLSKGCRNDKEERIVKRSADEEDREVTEGPATGQPSEDSEPTEEETHEEGSETTDNEEESQEGSEVAPTEQSEEGSGESEEGSGEEDSEEDSEEEEEPEEGIEHTGDPTPTEVITWELPEASEGPETSDGSESTDDHEGSGATEDEEESQEGTEPSEGTENTEDTQVEQRAARSTGDERRTSCRGSYCPDQETKEQRR